MSFQFAHHPITGSNSGSKHDAKNSEVPPYHLFSSSSVSKGIVNNVIPGEPESKQPISSTMISTQRSIEAIRSLLEVWVQTAINDKSNLSKTIEKIERTEQPETLGYIANSLYDQPVNTALIVTLVKKLHKFFTDRYIEDAANIFKSLYPTLIALLIKIRASKKDWANIYELVVDLAIQCDATRCLVELIILDPQHDQQCSAELEYFWVSSLIIMKEEQINEKAEEISLAVFKEVKVLKIFNRFLNSERIIPWVDLFPRIIRTFIQIYNIERNESNTQEFEKIRLKLETYNLTHGNKQTTNLLKSIRPTALVNFNMLIIHWYRVRDEKAWSDSSLPQHKDLQIWEAHSLRQVQNARTEDEIIDTTMELLNCNSKLLYSRPLKTQFFRQLFNIRVKAYLDTESYAILKNMLTHDFLDNKLPGDIYSQMAHWAYKNRDEPYIHFLVITAKKNNVTTKVPLYRLWIYSLLEGNENDNRIDEAMKLGVPVIKALEIYLSHTINKIIANDDVKVRIHFFEQKIKRLGQLLAYVKDCEPNNIRLNQVEENFQQLVQLTEEKAYVRSSHDASASTNKTSSSSSSSSSSDGRLLQSVGIGTFKQRPLMLQITKPAASEKGHTTVRTAGK